MMQSSAFLVGLSVIFCSFISFICGFNISPHPNYVFEEPTNIPTFINKIRSSYFGFSINLRHNSLIVGAPRAQSTIAAQRKINETGSVYKCNFESGQCSPYVFDGMGNTHVEDSPFAYNSEKKDFQWLGGSMDGHAAENDRFVVCAPRIVTELTDYYLLHGICYVASDTNGKTPAEVRKIIPMRQKNMQLYSDERFKYYNYMYAEQGLSVHVTANNEEILIGAPGVFNWRGSVVRYKAKFQDDIGGLSRRDGSSVRRNKRQIVEYVSDIPNAYRSNIADDSYFGYAVSSGYFENKFRLLYVASAPQANFQTGEVHIFDIVNSKASSETEIKTYFKFDGQQMGEYFGYALLTEDFNDDDLPDLAIAAPFHSKNSDFETGAVYIYMNEGQLNFVLQTILSSDYELNGRFGTTLSKIGDINQDGYNDIAVAAPYEESGVVYIFLGTNKGLSSKPSQRLVAPLNDLLKPSIKLFGHGLSSGVDIDRNGYNDIAIGAPDSEIVYVYKTYPVIKVVASVSPSKRAINIEDTSFQIKACWYYTSKTLIEHDIDIAIQLKIDAQHGRAVFSDRNNFKEMNAVVNNIDTCWDFDVYVKSSYKDIFKPIFIDLSYKLLTKIPENKEFCAKCVVTDPNIPNFVQEKVPFITGCKEEKCLSDLKLASKFLDFKSPYIIGSTKTISIQYDITNDGETAYLAQVNFTIPSFVQYSRIPSNCKLNDEEPTNNLLCDVGNGSPLFKGNKAKVVIVLDTTKLDGQILTVMGEVFSTGNEVNKEDNFMQDDIELKEFSEIEVIGKSSTPQINLELNKGIVNITHHFEVRNNGPSNMHGMNFNIYVPIKYNNPIGGQILNIIDFNGIGIEGHYNNKVLDITWTQDNTILLPNADESSTVKQEVDNMFMSADNYDLSKPAIDYDFMSHQNNDNFGTYSSNFQRRRKRFASELHYSYYTNEVFSHDISKRSLSNQNDYLPANRTIFFDCQNDNKHCVQASVSIDNFKAGNIPLFITMRFSLSLKNVEDSFNEKEDIFAFQITSNVEKIGDEDRSTFNVVQNNPATIVYKHLPEETPLWVVFASSFGGVLILVLISYTLNKFGFFKRAKKEEMEKLTRESKHLNDFDTDEE